MSTRTPPSTSISPARWPTWRPSACCTCCPARASGSRCSPRELPGAETFEAFAAARRRTSSALNIERARASWACSRCAGPSRSRSTARSAMRVATYAKSIGRTVPFAQAAFRQAFAGGRSLAETDNVLIAAAACEMHPTAVLKGAELRSVGEQLAAATAAAARAGVATCPRCASASVCSSASARSRTRPRHASADGRARDEGQPRLPADRHARRAGCRRCWPTPSGSTTSRSWRSTAARSCCSGTCPPQAASRIARALRADLAQLERRGVPRALELPWKLMSDPPAAVPDDAALPEPEVAREWLRDDDADPPLRGARRGDVRAREDRRLPAPVDRRGGDDRRQPRGRCATRTTWSPPTARTATRSRAARRPSG